MRSASRFLSVQFGEAPNPSREFRLAWNRPTCRSSRRPKRPLGQSLYTLDGPIAGHLKLEFTLQLKTAAGKQPDCRIQLSATYDPQRRQRESMPATVLAALKLPAEKRSKQQLEQVATYYRSISPALARLRAELAAAEKSKPKPPTLPIMRELPEKARRESFVLIKGNFMVRGELVEPGLPAALHPWPAGAPHNRLGLARWLVDKNNPLTARVAVNRFWSQLLGRGLVETEEDFGSQGAPPSHPELLDWLATEFMARGWDVKQLLRLIVHSSTYRQSSRTTPALLARDPLNRLFARGPRFRLEAEMVRDQALALSGLLSRKLYGPSVFPPQPEGLWQAAFNGRAHLVHEQRRRSLSPRAVYLLAAQRAVSVDGHVRRSQPRTVYHAPHPHQHAAASPGDAQRSGICGSGAGAGPADCARRGQQPDRSRPLGACSCAWCASRTTSK